MLGQVCIIGAGKMSRLLVKHLQSKGCERVTVLNRSLPRAEALAEEFPEVAFDIRLMPDLLECVAASDVIFAASGSEEILIRKEDLAGARMGLLRGQLVRMHLADQPLRSAGPACRSMSQHIYLFSCLQPLCSCHDGCRVLKCRHVCSGVWI